jgi:hypothetical protein
VTESRSHTVLWLGRTFLLCDVSCLQNYVSLEAACTGGTGKCIPKGGINCKRHCPCAVSYAVLVWIVEVKLHAFLILAVCWELVLVSVLIMCVHAVRFKWAM